MTNGYTLNMVQKGVFANGTLCYQFNLGKAFSNSSIVFYFLYNPSTSKVLYLQYMTKSPQCPSNTSTASSATDTSGAAQSALQQIILQFSLHNHPELLNYSYLYTQFT
jgi:hypothetical protein